MENKTVNYTSKTQKIEKYSKKYNISKEEAYRILTDDEALLTFDELKIRYDNPNLGQLPQWLLDEGGYTQLEMLIKKGIAIKYNYKFHWTTRTELQSYMLEFILKRIALYKKDSEIVAAVGNRMVWLWRQHFGRGDYFSMSLQDPVFVNDSDGEQFTYDSCIVNKADNKTDDVINIQSILQIPDKAMKELLIVIGYLGAGIIEMKPHYDKIKSKSKKEIADNLITLEDKLAEKCMLRPGSKTNVINAKDIIKAMNFKIPQEKGSSGVLKTLAELQEYVVNIGLVQTKLNN